MPTKSPKKQFFTLTADDEVRLKTLAPLFDVDFFQMDEPTCVLRTSSGELILAVELPEALAYRRLLAEICSKAAKWLHFHLEMMLPTSDDRQERIQQSRDGRDQSGSGSVDPSTLTHK